MPALRRSVTASREGLLDRRVRDVQAVRRVHGVVEVELRREQAGSAGDRHRAERTGREAAEQDRAPRVEVVVHVPRTQHRACLADVHRAARADHRRVAVSQNVASSSRHSSPAYWRLSNTMSWSCWRVNLSPGRPSVPVEPLLRHHEARPLAQRALGALVADDPVEALQRAAPDSRSSSCRWSS